MSNLKSKQKLDCEMQSQGRQNDCPHTRFRGVCARAPGSSLQPPTPSPSVSPCPAPPFPCPHPASGNTCLLPHTCLSELFSNRGTLRLIFVTSLLCFFLAGILRKALTSRLLQFSCPWDGDSDPSAQELHGCANVPCSSRCTLIILCSFLVSMLQFNKTVY